MPELIWWGAWGEASKKNTTTTITTRYIYKYLYYLIVLSQPQLNLKSSWEWQSNQLDHHISSGTSPYKLRHLHLNFVGTSRKLIFCIYTYLSITSRQPNWLEQMVVQIICRQNVPKSVMPDIYCVLLCYRPSHYRQDVTINVICIYVWATPYLTDAVTTLTYQISLHTEYI